MLARTGLPTQQLDRASAHIVSTRIEFVGSVGSEIIGRVPTSVSAPGSQHPG